MSLRHLPLLPLPGLPLPEPPHPLLQYPSPLPHLQLSMQLKMKKNLCFQLLPCRWLLHP